MWPVSSCATYEAFVPIVDSMVTMDVRDRLPQLGNTGAYLKQRLKDKLIEHKLYINRNGEDMPEIRNWTWHE